METNITDEEAALYDRQIRLWGLESQNRLKNASIILVGMSGVGAEVAKNLMLVGVKSLTLIDEQVVHELDLKTNCLLDKTTALNKNRVDAVLNRCKLLNPLVDVQAISVKPREVVPKTEELIATGKYTLVCCADRTVEECLKIDAACRQCARLFCMAAVNGWFGYCFNDFGDDFEYATEVNIPVGDKINQSGGDTHCAVLNLDDDEPTTKKQRIEEVASAGDTVQKNTIANIGEEKKMEKVVVRWNSSFTSLEEIFKNLNTDVSGDVKRKRSKPAYPVGFYLFQIMAEFRYQHKRNPRLATKAQDSRALLLERNALFSTLGDVKIDIPDNFASSLFEQVPAVCAIIGGVLSQEAIKAVSQKDEPINNMFFYNPYDSSGLTAQIPRR